MVNLRVNDVKRMNGNTESKSSKMKLWNMFKNIAKRKTIK